jgi:serine/threonine protein kinase
MTSITFFSGKRKRWNESISAASPSKSNLTTDMAMFEINKECASKMGMGLSEVDKSLSKAAEVNMQTSISPSSVYVSLSPQNSTGSNTGDDVSSGSDKRILGTPDYLAPELIMRKGHGPPVDFWSLGVCFYEFAIGILPFNDDSPKEIFKNIINRCLEFPDDMDQETQSCIEGLLEIDTGERLNLDKMKNNCKFNKLFSGIKWDNLYDMEAPFVPQPDSPMDVQYFTPRNEELNIQISALSTP